MGQALYSVLWLVSLPRYKDREAKGREIGRRVAPTWPILRLFFRVVNCDNGSGLSIAAEIAPWTGSRSSRFSQRSWTFQCKSMQIPANPKKLFSTTGSTPVHATGPKSLHPFTFGRFQLRPSKPKGLGRLASCLPFHFFRMPSLQIPAIRCTIHLERSRSGNDRGSTGGPVHRQIGKACPPRSPASRGGNGTTFDAKPRRLFDVIR